MVYVNCIYCKKEIGLEEIKVGKMIECECGCSQICNVIYDNETSGWRVLNPLNLKKIELGL